MFEMFSYGFMQKALAAGALIAAGMALIGMITVLRRQSMIGDALSHASLAGVALGLILGINPVGAAVVTAVISAFAIELFRHFFPKLSEMAIAIVMSAGIGLAGVLSGFVTAANFNSYLFGSIVSIPDGEFRLAVICSLAVIAVSLLLYKELFYISFDAEAAVLSGVPVRTVQFVFTLMTAVTIAVAARTVGALVVSSQLVLPVASAMQMAKSYRNTYRLAIALSLLYTVLGLIISFELDIKPGGTIVLTSLLGLSCLVIGRTVRRRIRAMNRGEG